MALYDEFTTPAKVNAQIDARLNGQKGTPNGLVQLNSEGKIDPTQLPPATEYRGVAVPSTVPSVGDLENSAKWDTTTEGTYTDMGGIIIDSTDTADGRQIQIVYTKETDSWSKQFVGQNLGGYAQTDIIPLGNQLFNKDTVTPDKRKFADGTTAVVAGQFYSDFIEVSPNSVYRFRSAIGTVGAFYKTAFNDSKVVVPEDGFNNTPTSTITTGPDTYYLQLTGDSAYLSDYMMNIGSALLPHEDYEEGKRVSKSTKVDESSLPSTVRKTDVKITQPDLSFAELTIGKNIFKKTDPDVTPGFYVRADTGTLAANVGYASTGFIPILPLTQYVSSNRGQQAYYNSSKIYMSGVVNSGSASPFTYTTPSGVAFVRHSIFGGNLDTFQVELGATSTDYEPYEEFYLLKNSKSEIPNSIIPDDEVPELLDSITGKPAKKSTTASIASGASLTITDFPYHIKKGIAMSFYCDISSFSGSIDFGKGIGQYRGSYITITPTKIQWKFDTAGTLQEEIDHTLTISTFVKCSMYIDDSSLCYVILQSLTGTFSTTFQWGYEFNYSPFLKSNGQALTNLKFNCTSKEFQHPVWAFGDSYFGVASNRWPGQMRDFGFFNFLLNGLAGQGSAGALDDFNRCLSYGTPKYLLWCLGMNDTDGVFTTNYNSVKAICEEKGITLILATVPTVPDRDKEVISALVRASGLRYIDFYKASGANSSGVWYSGYLSGDNLHPSDLGAEALAMQVLIDFPELMQYGLTSTDSEIGGIIGDL